MDANFRGAARPRTPAMIEQIAADLKIEIATLQAILAVEASGSGFDAKGRPKMLFEPHRFYKELKGKPVELAFAVKAELAYPNWGEKPYPRDSYPRLKQAIAIDRNAALRAASWGLGQILGSNHEAAGYASAEDMVAAFANSEDEQLVGVAGFLRGNGLVAAARRKDWDAVARGYNGKRYREGNYQTKLAAAYKKRPAWEKAVPKIPEPPPIPVPRPPAAVQDPPAVIVPEKPAAVPAPVSVDPQLMKVQQMLQDAGFPVGGIDGKWGEMTRSALAGFKASYNETVDDDLPLDNSYGPDVQLALLNWKRPVDPGRADATAGDLVKKGDPEVTLLTRIRNWLGIAPIAVVGAAKSGVGDQIKEVSDQVVAIRDAVDPLIALVADYWWVGILIGSGFVIYWATQRRKASVAEFNVGLRP